MLVFGVCGRIGIVSQWILHQKHDRFPLVKVAQKNLSIFEVLKQNQGGQKWERRQDTLKARVTGEGQLKTLGFNTTILENGFFLKHRRWHRFTLLNSMRISYQCLFASSYSTEIASCNSLVKTVWQQSPSERISSSPSKIFTVGFKFKRGGHLANFIDERKSIFHLSCSAFGNFFQSLMGTYEVSLRASAESF